MADSDNTVDTDDLDTFSELMFNGKVASEETAKPDEDEVEEVEEEIETPSTDESDDESDPEDDALAGDAEDDEDEEEEAPPPKPKGRKPASERIRELTAKAHAAERREAEALRMLEEARRPKEEKRPEAVREVEAKDDVPNPDTILEDGSPKYPLGEFDPTFIRDLTRYTIQQETALARQEEAKEKAAAEQERAEKELTDNWTSKLKDASEDLPDLIDKAATLDDTFRGLEPTYGKYLAATIMSLDYGPHVLDYLADHLDEARKIVASGPTQATIALAKIEARIGFEKEGNKVEKGKVKTSAPPPPPKNKGSSGKARSVAPDTDDLDAFEKAFFK